MLDCNIIKFQKIIKSVSELTYVLPDIQRNKDIEHVNKIYDYQNKMYEKCGQYILAGTISIAIVDDVEYLIDGQHRLSCYNLINNEYQDRALDVTVDYYTCKTYNDVEILYKNVNTCKQNDITKMKISSYKIITEVDSYFKTHFKSFLSTGEKPYRPSFNLSKLLIEIENRKIISRANITSGKDFVFRIQELNKFYAHCTIEQFNKWHVKVSEAMIQKIKLHNTNLYFGLYSNYEWLEVIVSKYITGKNYKELPHYSETYRPKISKDLRKKVWGSSDMCSNCYCCDESLDFDNFECGHIIPVCQGGLTHLNNLKPICHECNKDMGTMNLEEYKKIRNEQS